MKDLTLSIYIIQNAYVNTTLLNNWIYTSNLPNFIHEIGDLFEPGSKNFSESSIRPFKAIVFLIREQKEM